MTGSTLVGTSAVSLVSYSLPAAYGVRIKAAAGNSSYVVYVGLTSNVDATTGFPLSAQDEMLVPAAATASADGIFLLASHSDCKVFWMLVPPGDPSLIGSGTAADFNLADNSGLAALLF